MRSKQLMWHHQPIEIYLAMKYLLNRIILFLLIFVTLASCSGGEKGNSNNGHTGSSGQDKTTDLQLNISIFLDLSARIMPTKENPNPKDRDLEAIQAVVDFFRKNMKSHGAYKANGKLRVLFNPTPEDPEINTLASVLQVDLGTMDNRQKKETFDNIQDRFSTALGRIYDQSLQDQKWVGADIWRFFKKDVSDHCILRDYRNILVIITDGYIYHERSKQKADNRYSYLVGPLFQSLGLRKNVQWQSIVETKDFGLISTRSDLESLEVLVLEICPEVNHPEDEDILEYLLGKWLKEMGIVRFKIHSTDLPVNTKANINRFLAQPI